MASVWTWCLSLFSSEWEDGIDTGSQRGVVGGA